MTTDKDDTALRSNSMSDGKIPSGCSQKPWGCLPGVCCLSKLYWIIHYYKENRIYLQTPESLDDINMTLLGGLFITYFAMSLFAKIIFPNPPNAIIILNLNPSFIYY